MSVTSLNNNLILHVFSFLPLTSYKSLILTCHRFNSLVANNQSLLQSWCISKFPKYIAETTPLPNDMDFKWLLMCLHFDISHKPDPDSHKYGFIQGQFHLRIRSIIRISIRRKAAHVITQGININLSLSHIALVHSLMTSYKARGFTSHQS